jgi:2-hydroxychromene-2-carboxylate isomerase
MMMRGMNVPQTKKMYIFLDTKREAQKHSISYGFVADPLGVAVERCYALLAYARKEDKLIEFLVSFSRAVNAEGIRAETDQGLKQIVERCGLQWNIAKKQLTTNDQWRKQVNDNLNEMFNAGCWGVPSFSYNNQSFWGQDRLGIIEHKIRKNLID